MKITIFLLIALFALAQAEPSCDLDSMCMGCDATTADKCTQCYNGVVATYGPRALVSNACSTKLTEFTGCTIYRSTLTAAAMPTSGNYPCWKCATGKVNTATLSSGVATTGGITTTIVGLTTAYAASCADSNPTGGVQALTNCSSLVAVPDTNDAAAGQMCLITADGYMHDIATSATDAIGKQALTQTGVATGCKNYIYTMASTPTSTCHDPTSGNAINAAGTAGVAFTTDTSCRQLATGDLVCGVCTDAYWFGGAKCYLTARMLALSAAALFTAWLL